MKFLSMKKKEQNNLNMQAKIFLILKYIGLFLIFPDYEVRIEIFVSH